MEVFLKTDEVGSSVGSNLTITADIGTVVPNSITKNQLLSGVTVLVNNSASQLTIYTGGLCNNPTIVQISTCPTPPAPTATPTTTPTATPTATPLVATFVLTGPSQSSAEQQIDLTTSGGAHKAFFYNNWNGSTFDTVGTVIAVNGIGVAMISHTADRVGQTFGYNINGSASPQVYGTLTNRGTVNFTI
jgi:hypothetical protein